MIYLILFLLFTSLGTVINNNYNYINFLKITIAFVLITYLIFDLSFMERFIKCDEGNHIMEPNESEDFIDPSIKELKLSNLGFKGSRYPFNPKYIPSKKKNGA